MTIILDPELKALMAQDQAVAVLWQDAEQGRTALLAKASDEDVASFRGKAPIRTQWELGRFACGSVLRLHVAIFDRPDNPYRFETFLNVSDPDQLACGEQLLIQETLPLHFFDSQTEYVFTKMIASSHQQRKQLEGLIIQARQDQAHLGESWDFDQAKVLFQAQRPL